MRHSAMTHHVAINVANISDSHQLLQYTKREGRCSLWRNDVYLADPLTQMADKSFQNQETYAGLWKPKQSLYITLAYYATIKYIKIE